VSKQRNDQGRSQSGPLTTDELESLFERGYGLSSHRFISQAWDLDPDAEPERVAAQIEDEDQVAERLESLDTVPRAILSQVAASGGRMRGENLRRDLLLRGFGDTEDILRDLVAQCILVPIPNPGESELDIEALIDQDNFLQHDLAVPPLVERELHDEAESLGPEAVGTWKGDIETTRPRNLDALELNLLHLSSLLQQEPLRLNKSGAPNRRSLRRFARGITFPGDRGEAGDDLDLNDAIQLDYLTFLLAMALEMGFIEKNDDETVVNGRHDEVREFFCADENERNRYLINAFQGLEYWSEVESLSLAIAQRHPDYEEHFSLTESTGEPFIGARGYVLSVLRRSRLGRWTRREAIVELCSRLDPNYLPRTLSNADTDVEALDYIEAVLERGLVWLGAIEVGESEDGVEALRFQGRGAEVIGLKTETEEDEDEPEEPPSPQAEGEGCLVVQPNYEVMLFLDAAPLDVIFHLYHIGERNKLSERVANFQLTAESVQWGFSHGLDADGVIELLNDNSHAPVPDTVEFQLRDWERVHQQLELYANGVLLRHADADQLDLILGQLEHDWRGEDIETIRLGQSSVFIPEPDPPGLDRVIDQEDALDIDYLGEIPPSLYFVDSLELMVDPLECDLVTLSELEKIADKLEEPSSEGSQFYKLSIDAIQARWPENTLEEIIEFLDARTAGGIPPGQALKLKSLLQEPLHATLSEDVLVVMLESKIVADHFGRVPECEMIIEERVGERAFTVKEEHREELDEILEDLKIKASYK
jgi:hypothetical protein